MVKLNWYDTGCQVSNEQPGWMWMEKKEGFRKLAPQSYEKRWAKKKAARGLRELDPSMRKWRRGSRLSVDTNLRSS